MDILATQTYDDNDLTSTQQIDHPVQQDKTLGAQVGVLNVGSNVYSIKKGINKIGRHPECHIVLNDQTVSKKHAEIEATNDETSAWICDLNSSNKTKLNNSVLRPGRCYELKDGSVLEFGVVRAIYKVCRSADDFLLPETPLSSRQKNQQLIIPGTPDSSAELNSSSTLGDNESVIPGTQTNDGESTFRRPPVPQRSSTYKKSIIHDSTVDSSLDNSGSFIVGDKENVGKQKVSIYDMETQNQSCDIHDMETQHEEDVNDRTREQYDIDIHDMETPKICTKNPTAWVADDSVQDKNPEAIAKGSVEDKTKIKIKDASCLKDTNENEAAEEQNSTVLGESTKDMQKDSDEYLQLSLATNFEDDSELNTSTNLLGSQNLLDHIMEENEPPDQTKSPTLLKSISLNDDEVNDKSTDDENIHEAATQVKIHDENACKSGLEVSQGGGNDSDGSTQGVFQSYSFVRSKDSEKPSQEHRSGSDDSDTDEEGHFAKIALKERQNLSSSFEKHSSNEAKNSCSSSKESEDMFDMLTQHVSSKKKNDNGGKGEVDFNAPTQVVGHMEGSTAEEKVIDIVPPEILSTIESITKEVPAVSSEKGTKSAVRKDVTEMDDDAATQIISASEMPSENDHVESPSPSNQLNPNPVEECSVEDIDYEMAPTQLISEVERKKATGKKKTSRKSKKLNKVNFNDTVERNLNAMFEEVNDESIEDQQQISTQVLKNVLQSSQSECSDELPSENSKSNVNNNILTKVRKSPRGRKPKTAAAGSVPKSIPKTQVSNLKDPNTDSDSQNTENYFSVLTSTRKRNVFVDSQDLVDPSEHVSSDKTIMNHNRSDEDSVCCSPTRSKPKSSSTPIPSRKINYDEAKVLVEKIADPKDNEDPTTDSPRNDLAPDAPRDTEQDNYKILDIDEEDIMAGFPEVRISGTLSNPPSPTLTSGVHQVNTYGRRSKRGSESAAVKKKAVTRKSTRKTSIIRKNTEIDAPYCISKSGTSSHLRSLPDQLPANVDAELLSTGIDEKVNSNSKRSLRNTMADKSLRERKSTPSVTYSQEQPGQSPFVQNNGRTRSSSKKNVDQSSVFQVEKEAPVKNVSEPARPNASRVGKRSLSATDSIESIDAKKRREDMEEGIQSTTKGRRSNSSYAAARRRYSANILNFITKKSSPLSIKDSNSPKLPLDELNLINKQAVINIVRLSPYDSVGSLSPSSPAETVDKNVNNETMQTQVEQPSKAKIAQPRRGRKAINRRKATVEEDLSSQGEESQEVERIMSNSIVEQNTNSDTDSKRNEDKSKKKGARTRNTRKRTNATKEPDESASDICEPNTPEVHFEVPTSRGKRAKLSRTTSNLLSTTAKEELAAKMKSTRQSRSAQAQSQVISESSAEEHLESSADQSSLDATGVKANNSKRKRKSKAEKLEANKKQNKQIQDSSISSEINSSIEAASVMLTPNRTRGSMSSQSPFKIKHKILFTGITSNDYNKLLTKLGASQVEDPTKCTVLVTDKVRRTVKFLCALAQSVPIVSIDWLVESKKAGHFVELQNYILKDPAAEAKFGFKLRSSLEKAKNQKLLEEYSIVLTPNVAPPPIPELKSIIVSCGGKALIRPPSSWPEKAVIISREEDLVNAKKFLAKAPNTVTIQSTEFILTGILKQELDFIKYKLT